MGRTKIAALAVAAGVLAGAGGSAAAMAGTGPGGGGHNRKACAPHDLTLRHESLARFDRVHQTFPAAVAGETWRCYHGEMPHRLLAYFNAGRWHFALPAHAELFFISGLVPGR